MPKILNASKIGFSFFIFLCVVHIGLGAESITIYPRLVVEEGPRVLRKASIDELAAFRYDGKGWREVALQVDERNDRGDFVLNQGLPFTKDSDDNYVDYNDDVVFSGPDFGEAFTDDQVPENIRSQARALWRLEISSQGQCHGFLLVVAIREPRERNQFPALVQFDSVKGTVASENYEYHFRRNEAALLGQVNLKKDGQLHPLIKSSMFMLQLKLPWYLPNFSLTQDNFLSEIESWQVGPLRTIVAVGVKFSGFLTMFDLHLFSELLFSASGFQIPTVIEFPIDTKTNFRPGTGIAYGISFAEDLAWQFRSNLESLPAMSPEDLYKTAKRASEYPYFFALGNSPFGGAVVRVLVDKKAAAQSLPPYIVNSGADVSKLRENWSWIDELTGDVRVFLDISSVPKGSYDFGLDLILTDKASEEIITDVDALRTHWSEITPSSR